ncbi:hypothetical protein BREU_2140 [Bifidobacterium reuteri DSM 23975]|uniref:Uncharacterized protein n=1 Tax=Bifidobacterium reuteri DSM 23975 TaxID=1437610 RepID=A0A087CL04_9BIFI|nr:hypothetical protein BREU_2140 [Bifidobacterium reuteri DSM 23975]TPF91657.1 hypothetical protein BW14_11780 [Bifidobacterium sp. UTBIF-68]
MLVKGYASVLLTVMEEFLLTVITAMVCTRKVAVLRHIHYAIAGMNRILLLLFCLIGILIITQVHIERLVSL